MTIENVFAFTLVGNKKLLKNYNLVTKGQAAKDVNINSISDSTEMFSRHENVNDIIYGTRHDRD